jgi:hypothetical protein
VYALAILTLVASLAAPEARHDLAAADRLAAAIDRASTRAAANVESRSTECIDAASPPASVRGALLAAREIMSRVSPRRTGVS